MTGHTGKLDFEESLDVVDRQSSRLEQHGYDAQITTTHPLIDDGFSDPSLERYHARTTGTA